MGGNDCNGYEKYLEKINCFVDCMRCRDWIATADAGAVDTVLSTAIDIERTLAQEEASKLNEILKTEYPDFDLTRSADIALEAIIPSEANEEIILYAINKYGEEHKKNKLCELLQRLLETKRVKEKLISVIGKLKSENITKMLEAKLVVHLWEEMIASNNDNVENSIIDIFSKDATLFLSYLRVSCKNTSHIIVSVILKYLDSQPDSKLWFELLNDKNREMTLYICSQHDDFLEGLLRFLKKYSFEVECPEGEIELWSHKDLPVSEFVSIINFFLINDGKVGIAVNDFINTELSNFGENLSFWVHVKALLL